MSGSHVSNNDPEVIEKAVRRSLQVPAHVPSAPQWSETLASDAEAVIKAERHATGGGSTGPGTRPAEPGDVSGDIAELQTHTIRVVSEEAWLDTVVDAPPRKGADEELTHGSDPN